MKIAVLGLGFMGSMHLRALRDSGRTVLPGHDPAVLRAGPVHM